MSLLGRLFGSGEPDGQAGTLEADATRAGETIGADMAQARLAVARAPGTVITAALGQKVLHSWLQNRHQTRFPLVLNLRNISGEEAALLMEVVLQAVALVDPAGGRARASEFVQGIGGRLPEGDGGGVSGLVERLREARLAAQGYAACAGAIGRRSVAGRRYLDFLAARLEIPDEVARSINRRFAS